MTIKEIEKLKARLQYSLEIDFDACLLEQDKQAIIEALEKQIPIKPIDDTKPRDFFINIYCSVCKEPVTKRFKYCRNCGQALDWRDDECQDQRQ